MKSIRINLNLIQLTAVIRQVDIDIKGFFTVNDNLTTFYLCTFINCYFCNSWCSVIDITRDDLVTLIRLYVVLSDVVFFIYILRLVFNFSDCSELIPCLQSNI